MSNPIKFLSGLIFLLSLSPVNASAEQMPCEYVAKQITEYLEHRKSYKSEFLQCLTQYRVCVIGDSVIKKQSIQEVPHDDMATFAIVQSPANDSDPVCLISIFSGGSSAAWFFEAYSTK